MTFEDERDQLLEKLAKIPDLEALLKSGSIGDHLVAEDEATRAVLPYGGPAVHRGSAWKMTNNA